MNNVGSLKWWIVEDALRDRKGHWSEYLQTFRRGLEAEGDEVCIFAARECEPALAEALGAEPVLPKSIWARRSRVQKWLVKSSRFCRKFLARACERTVCTNGPG